jgi:hypothetical protein
MDLAVTTDRISKRRPALRALHVTYGQIPYYPDTHPDGHLYVHCLKDEKRLPQDIFDDVRKKRFVNGYRLVLNPFRSSTARRGLGGINHRAVYFLMTRIVLECVILVLVSMHVNILTQRFKIFRYSMFLAIFGKILLSMGHKTGMTRAGRERH